MDLPETSPFRPVLVGREIRAMPESKQIRIASRSLLSAIGFAVFGNGLLSTASALRLAESGIAEGSAGIVLAAYFGGLVVGSLTLQTTIQRVGSVRAFTAFTALSVVTALLHGLIPPGAIWIVLRGMNGLALAGFYITVEGWLTTSAGPESRGRVLSIYLVTLYLGLSLGQFAIPILAAIDVDPMTVSALSAGLAATIVALTTTREPQFDAFSRLSAHEVIRRAPIGWLGALTAGIVIGTIYTSFPLMLRAAGISESDSALLLGVALLGGLLGQGPIGSLSDRGDRRIILLGVAVLLAVLCALSPEPRGSERVAMTVHAALFGALTFALYPLSVAHALDRAPSEHGLGLVAQLILISSAGSMVGPVAASALSDAMGSQGFYLTNGLCLVSLAGYVALRIARVEPVEQDDYRAIPRTSVVVGDLDPRTHVD
jgi:MFS family permease